jgi:hypothetical protein
MMMMVVVVVVVVVMRMVMVAIKSTPPAPTTISSLSRQPPPSSPPPPPSPNHDTLFSTKKVPIPYSGYWVDRTSLKYIGQIYICPRETCLGAVTSLSSSNSRSSSSSSSSQDDDEEEAEQCWIPQAYPLEGEKQTKEGEEVEVDSTCSASLCKTGSHGIVCGSCLDSFTFNSALGTCVKCDSSANLGPLVVIVALVLLVGVFLVLQYKGYEVVPPWFFQLAPVRVAKNVDKGMLKVVW